MTIPEARHERKSLIQSVVSPLFELKTNYPHITSRPSFAHHEQYRRFLQSLHAEAVHSVLDGLSLNQIKLIENTENSSQFPDFYHLIAFGTLSITSIYQNQLCNTG